MRDRRLLALTRGNGAACRRPVEKGKDGNDVEQRKHQSQSYAFILDYLDKGTESLVTATLDIMLKLQ
jgi:hypothetical protein